MTETDQAARRRLNRARGLHALGFAALIWVSKGSYDTIIWASNATGGERWWSVLYPVIVDMGVIMVMPYSNNAALPNDGQWPVRKNARQTIMLAFAAIVTFNALHSVLQALTAVTLPVWLKPVVALIAGAVPVAIYIRVMGLHAMATSWEGEETVRIAREARESAATQEREARESAAAAARDARESEQRAKEKTQATDAEIAIINAKADADAKVVEAQGRARAERQASRNNLAGPTRKNPAPPDANPLVADLPGNTKFEKAVAYLEREWAAGRDITGTEASRALGCSDDYGRKAAAKLRRDGVLPPSERPAKLSLAGQRP